MSPKPPPEEQLNELLSRNSPSPAQLRRIAELVKRLYGDEVSRIWWQKAADAGDEDAIGMLETLEEEDREQGNGP